MANDPISEAELPTPAPPPAASGRAGSSLVAIALLVGILALTASAFLIGVFVGSEREARQTALAERGRPVGEPLQSASLAAAPAPGARPTPPPAEQAAPTPKAPPAATPTPAPSPTPATPTPTPAPRPTPAVTTALATAPVRKGGMQLKIASVQVGQIPLQEKMFGEQLYTPETNLAIQVELTNTSSTWKTDYATWVDEAGSREKSSAILRDNFGNSYHPVPFKTIKPVGKIAGASLYPGQTIGDLLVFERPIAATRALELELPASNFGGEGVLRLQIPASMIKGLQ